MDRSKRNRSSGEAIVEGDEGEDDDRVMMREMVQAAGCTGCRRCARCSERCFEDGLSVLW